MKNLNTNNAPLISVVIPMYNVSSYIENCLSSVLQQTFTLFEVICVDDGCTDDTVERVQAINDARIRIVRQNNKGLAAARNTGINASRTPFIALLDADDFWHQEKLAAHFEHLCDNPNIGVSYSSSLFVNDNNELIGLGQYPKTHDISPEHILCRNPVGNGSAAVIRRMALEDIAFTQTIGGDKRKAYFDETLRQSEDIELWVRLSLNTQWGFEGINKALTYYRVNASGLSANLDKQFASWQRAITSNQKRHPEFFFHWYSLSKAYQKRYLSRRAVQSNNAPAAIKLFLEALITDLRIVWQEPLKTLVTGACAFLTLLPKPYYSVLQKSFIKLTLRKASPINV